MIRVLLDCRMADWSGVGRYTSGLARALAARDDIELVQVCRVGSFAPVLPGALVEVAEAAAHPFSLRGALELSRLVTWVRPEVVHCTHFPTPVPVRTPLVVTLHDLLPLVMPGLMPSKLKRGVYRRWNKRATRVADVVVVPSRATAEDLGCHLPSPRGRISVIPDAADDLVSGPVGPLPARLAALASKPYLLSIGSTRTHKDIPTLLRAFAALSGPEAEDLRLLLVGDEPSGYLDRILPPGAADARARIVFTGKVADRDLCALYAGAVAFVFPSLHEGFGLPPLEAMSLGAPVISAGTPVSAEVLGDASLLFPAGDAGALAEGIRRLLVEPGLRDGLIGTGRRRAALFSWERTAAATVVAYHDAMRAAGGRKGRAAT